MAIAWFYTAYDLVETRPGRRSFLLPTAPYEAAIRTARGRLVDIELPRKKLLVGVRATAAILNTIGADAKFERFPARALHVPLADLTQAQRRRFKALLNDLGYDDAAIRKRFGRVDFSTVTLAQFIKYAASRNFKPKPQRDWLLPGVPEFETASRHAQLSDGEIDDMFTVLDSGDF